MESGFGVEGFRILPRQLCGAGHVTTFSPCNPFEMVVMGGRAILVGWGGCQCGPR